MSQVTPLSRAQIKARRTWADALQSSKKAQGALGVPGGGMCCLGVACHVLAAVPLSKMFRKDYPASVGVDLEEIAGVVGEERLQLADKNDAEDVHAGMDPEWEHPDIGLYLYLTAEAGVAPFSKYD
jgi:hypothetical protein